MTPPTITYIDPGDIRIAPWQTTKDGTYVTAAVACIAHGVLTAFDAAISPHGTWKVAHDDQVRSGRARSDTDARPHVEDALSWWARELVERHRADGLEQAMQRSLTVGDATPEPTVTDTTEPPEASPGPRPPTTPIWDSFRLSVMSDRIGRVRRLHGWSWRVIAETARREGGPAVDQTTWRSWAIAEHSPIQGNHATLLDAWLATYEQAPTAEEDDDLTGLFD